MKSKQQKKEDLKKLEVQLPKAKITIFTTFARAGEKGLSVKQMQELKRAMRVLNSGYTTAKKTLLEIALRDLKYDGLDVYSMDGSIGIVLGPEKASEDELNTIAKKLHEFSKKNPSLKFFGAVVEGKVVAKEVIVEMAQMPSREVLLARLFGMMKYPLSALAITLNEIAKKKEGVVTV